MQAKALAEFYVDALDAMAFSARRELQQPGLGPGNLRHARLLQAAQEALPNKYAPKQLDRIEAFVQAGNTSTSGIVEQRYVDAVTTTLHPEGQPWKSRGVGDSVNATNLSCRKLGDCDFQDTAGRTVAAYEAHGGMLTKAYVDKHLATLQRVAPKTYEMREENDGGRERAMSPPRCGRRVRVPSTYSCCGSRRAWSDGEVGVLFVFGLRCNC